MTVVRAAVEVDAPPEDVWIVVSDPRNLPRWDRHITKVEGIPEGGVSEGTEYEAELRFMGARGKVTAEVLEFAPPSWSRVRLTGFLDAMVTTSVTPLGDGRSRLEHEVDYRFRAGPLGRLAARGLRLVGGPRHVLKRGTLIQKRDIEDG